jgi:hypothetical protein
VGASKPAESCHDVVDDDARDSWDVPVGEDEGGACRVGSRGVVVAVGVLTLDRDEQCARCDLTRVDDDRSGRRHLDLFGSRSGGDG